MPCMMAPRLLTRAWCLALAGPNFVKYNAVLRGFPKADVDGLKGNTYATTIHAIVSAIKKIQAITAVPKDGFVYRGAKNMRVSDVFMTPNKSGASGVSRSCVCHTSCQGVGARLLSARGCSCRAQRMP